MAAQFCNKRLEDLTNLVDLEGSFLLTMCVLNFMFCPVAVVGNLLVIRALWKASSIPANVRKLFLSLAFSDLAAGMFPQPMAGVILAVTLKMASTGENNFFSLCPAVLNVRFFFFGFLACVSFLNVTAIAVDRLVAVLLHLRYQELVTSKRVIIALVSLWLTSGVAVSMVSSLSKGNKTIGSIIGFVGLLLTTAAYIRVYKVVRHHRNQIQSQLQMHNAQAVELLRQKKSACNALVVYVLFVVCYLPCFTCAVLYTSYGTQISFKVSALVARFLVVLQSSFNPLVHCWRYREIREIVKSTVKKIFRIKENGTQDGQEMRP